MKTPQKFNADYESVLFHGKEAPPVINQSLEFLYLYLEDAPLHSSKQYSNEFLEHVESISGVKPRIFSQGLYENWWGPLKDISHERRVNSKEMSARFIEDSQIIYSIDELNLDRFKQYLAKPLSEMSGRGFSTFDHEHLKGVEELLKKKSPVIVEPLLNRKFDFSHYILPDKDICYENIVDSHFQYKGTTFRNLKNPSAKSLSFYDKITDKEWSGFFKIFSTIKDTYVEANVKDMYSIDSFVYLERDTLKIRAMTEVNVRKTMGYIAWKLSEKFAKNAQWSQFLLAKNKGKLSFKSMKEKAQSLGCLYLSPGDTRFEIFFLMAKSEEEGKLKSEELKRLLPDTEFPI